MTPQQRAEKIAEKHFYHWKVPLRWLCAEDIRRAIVEASNDELEKRWVAERERDEARVALQEVTEVLRLTRISGGKGGGGR